MTTDVTIRLLSNDYRLKMQVQDEINSKYIIYEPHIDGKTMRITVDDAVTREGIISALSEGVLEYIDTIEVGKRPIVEDKAEDNPFQSAYSMIE